MQDPFLKDAQPATNQNIEKCTDMPWLTDNNPTKKKEQTTEEKLQSADKKFHTEAKDNMINKLTEKGENIIESDDQIRADSPIVIMISEESLEKAWLRINMTT